MKASNGVPIMPWRLTSLPMFPTHGEHLQRAAALERMFGSLSGMAGVNYHSGDLILRANLGRSFRVPPAKELSANGVNYHHFSYEEGNASLKPETAWQLDIGGEYAFANWSARFSPFLTWFPNYIYLNPSHMFDYDHGAGNQIFHYTASEVLPLHLLVFHGIRQADKPKAACSSLHL